MSKPAILTDARLLELNSRGLIPGPMEEEAAFAQRVEYCLDLSHHLQVPLNPEVLAHPARDLSYYYDVSIDWVPVIFSNARLTPWHGGCAWIFQENEASPTGALIQLRQRFHQHKRYLKIYDRDELLRHELVHVGRMVFEEPRFEEMLAYGTSSHWFRHWFGPLVQAPWESILFVLTLAFLCVFDLFLFSTGQSHWFEIALNLKLIPVGMVALALVRLARKKWQYRRCLARLESLFESAATARAVAYRLTDDEVRAFGGFTEEEIRRYASLRSREELRWRVINEAYF